MESLSEKRERVISLTRQEQENERFNPDWAKELREEIDILEAEIAELEQKKDTLDENLLPTPAVESDEKPKARLPKKPVVKDRQTIVSRTNNLLDMLKKSQKENNF